MTKIQKWEQLDSQVVFDTPYFNIRKDACRLPNGHEIDDYYVLQSTDIALVVACTPSDEFVLVEQYKHGIGEICLEIPGGMCEQGSTDPLVDAQRELREETGYISQKWQQLVVFTNNSTRSTVKIYIYLALDAFPQGEQSLDVTEDIAIHLVKQSHIMPMIVDGKINVADSVAALMLALDWLKN